MIVAMNQIGDKPDRDSAAGKFENGNFKSGKNAAIKCKIATQKRYGDESIEYDHISQYVPKLLSIDLVEWATDILFLGREFMDNTKYEFPMEYHNKMRFYGMHTNNEGLTMYEIPDLFDGESWPDYYGDTTKRVRKL